MYQGPAYAITPHSILCYRYTRGLWGRDRESRMWICILLITVELFKYRRKARDFEKNLGPWWCISTWVNWILIGDWVHWWLPADWEPEAWNASGGGVANSHRHHHRHRHQHLQQHDYHHQHQSSSFVVVFTVVAVLLLLRLIITIGLAPHHSLWDCFVWGWCSVIECYVALHYLTWSFKVHAVYILVWLQLHTSQGCFYPWTMPWRSLVSVRWQFAFPTGIFCTGVLWFAVCVVFGAMDQPHAYCMSGLFLANLF